MENWQFFYDDPHTETIEKGWHVDRESGKHGKIHLSREWDGYTLCGESRGFMASTPTSGITYDKCETCFKSEPGTI